MSDNEQDKWIRAGSLEGLGITTSEAQYEMAYREKQQMLAGQAQLQPAPQIAGLPRGCLLYGGLSIAFAFAIEYLASRLLGLLAAFNAAGTPPPQFVAGLIFGTGRLLIPLVGLALFIDWIRYWRGSARGILRIALFGLRWMLILAIPAAAIIGALLISGQLKFMP